MTRDPVAEAVALRLRLRDTEVRLQLLAQAVVADPEAAQGLARLLLQWTQPGEPEAPAEPQAVSLRPAPHNTLGVDP